MTSVLTSSNSNLYDAEKELLRWHFRLGHISFTKVQHLMRSGILSHSEGTRRLHKAAASLRHAPRCEACSFAKQKVRSSPGRKISTIHDVAGKLKSNHIFPGKEVSVDHFICSTKGRLFESRGKSKESDMYCGGCLFIDQCSNYIFVAFQDTLHSHKTVLAKEAFEAHSRDYGVVIQKYLTDNSTAFTGEDFRRHLENFHQVIRFAGAGAHHHNGHAERAIGTIMSITRAMLIHSALHWPELADPALWPMCVAHAVYLWNHMPDPTTGLSPADIFTKSRWKLSQFLDVHVFGCPTYVLDSRLADGRKIPKWTPRSTRCMYVGKSPTHASTVPLVLNPDTGTIIPRFHVVFDDWFQTVSTDVKDLPDFNDPAWKKFFGESVYQYEFDDEDLEMLKDLIDDLDTSCDAAKDAITRSRVESAMDMLRPPPSPGPLPTTLPPPPVPAITNSSPPPALPSSADPSLSSPTVRPEGEKSVTVSPPVMKKLVSPPAMKKPQITTSVNASPPVLQKSQPTKAISPPVKQQSQNSSSLLRLPKSQSVPLRRSTRHQEKRTPTQSKPIPISVRRSKRIQEKVSSVPPAAHFLSIFTAFGISPMSVFAASSDPDTYTFDAAMRSEFKEEFIKAASVEVKELEGHHTWTEVKMQDVKGPVIPSTWVFKIKRRPDGTIKKFKARLCLRGDLQQGQFESYAPVASFPSLRILLITALMFNWKTCCIDFVNAFVQAKLESDVWMHLPRGSHSKFKEKTCLKLLRSLYGAVFSPRLWYQLLRKVLLEIGFGQCKSDPCFFLKENIYLVVHVDDCRIAYKDEEVLNWLVNALEKKGLLLTKEGSFHEYLGISYEHKENKILLTQKGLIKKIIEAVGLKSCNSNFIPASTECLGIDPNGEPMTETWSYPSIVGMLLYLSSNTRPDICFAVSQVARFTHSPKQSHATAVKSIVRYLSGTSSEGTIISQPTSHGLTCFPDSDFAGLFKRDPDDSPSSAKSRSGYIIKFCDCPLLWKSQLQPTIALSTAEAEYYSLSQAMRALLPIRSTLKEFFGIVQAPVRFTSLSNYIPTTVYVDNTSALTLARDQQITSRTRHYHCRFHFF